MSLKNFSNINFFSNINKKKNLYFSSKTFIIEKFYVIASHLPIPANTKFYFQIFCILMNSLIIFIYFFKII